MRFILFAILYCFSLSVFAQRVIIITELPANTPDGAVLHLGASANGWNPGHPDWIFESFEALFILDVPAASPDVFEGKVTMGDWASVEGTAVGGFVPNRAFDFTASDTLYVVVAGWEGMPGGGDDLPPNVVVLDDAFFMPELDRSRRIRLFLPSNYDSTTDHYPVLYMHDGQNLFSAQEAFAGEWEVDEAMLDFESEGYNGAIVVAIDNGGSYRIAEYTPYAHPEYGGGDGAAYTDFLVNTLKPHVDENYRTLTDRENTGIMGSSLGGLISFYAGIRHQDIFSKVGVFSPSFWFSEEIYTFVETTGKNADMQFFFLAGEQESATLVGQIEDMTATMTSVGFTTDEWRFDSHPNGQHSEWFWAQEFPTAFEWLYMNATTDLTHAPNLEKLMLSPNPAMDTIYFILPEGHASADVQIFDVSGRLLFEKRNVKSAVDISTLPKGMYQLRLSSESGKWTENFVKL